VGSTGGRKEKTKLLLGSHKVNNGDNKKKRQPLPTLCATTKKEKESKEDQVKTSVVHYLQTQSPAD